MNTIKKLLIILIVASTCSPATSICAMGKDADTDSESDQAIQLLHLMQDSSLLEARCMQDSSLPEAHREIGHTPGISRHSFFPASLEFDERDTETVRIARLNSTRNHEMAPLLAFLLPLSDIQNIVFDYAQIRDKDVEKANICLINATYANDTQKVLSALREGAYVDTKSFDMGQTPLQIATEYSFPNIVSLLLNHRANSNVTSGFGRYRVPLHIASYGIFFHGPIPMDKRLETIQILINHHASINARDGAAGKTSLEIAIENDCFEIAKMLMAAGADPYMKNCEGKIVWHSVGKKSKIKRAMREGHQLKLIRARDLAIMLIETDVLKRFVPEQAIVNLINEYGALSATEKTVPKKTGNSFVSAVTQRAKAHKEKCLIQ